jgi:hypothetical protein
VPAERHHRTSSAPFLLPLAAPNLTPNLNPSGSFLKSNALVRREVASGVEIFDPDDDGGGVIPPNLPVPGSDSSSEIPSSSEVKRTPPEAHSSSGGHVGERASEQRLRSDNNTSSKRHSNSSTSTRDSDRSESPPLHPCAFGAEEDGTTTLALGGEESDYPDDVSPEDFLYYNPSGGVAGGRPPIDPDFLFFNPSVGGMDPFGGAGNARKESDEDPVFYYQVSERVLSCPNPLILTLILTLTLNLTIILNPNPNPKP